MLQPIKIHLTSLLDHSNFVRVDNVWQLEMEQTNIMASVECNPATDGS